jgi:two-component system response regulator MprA
MARREVLVVTTDGFATDALADALADDGWSVRRALGGPLSDAAVAGSRAAAIVLEAPASALPGAARRLRGLTSGVIVAVTTGAGADTRLAALAAGADDVLDRGVAEQELAVRLRVLTARRAGGNEVLLAGDLQVDLAAREATRGGRRLELTPSEFELLVYLMANAGIALSRQAIVDNVWRDATAPTGSRVSVLVFRLRRKLEAEGEPRLLHAVRGWGYVLRSVVNDL